MAVHISAAPKRVEHLHITGIYSATLREACERHFGWDEPSSLVLGEAETLALDVAVLERYRQLLIEGKPIEVYRLFVGGSGCRMPSGSFPGSRQFVVSADDSVRPVG